MLWVSMSIVLNSCNVRSIPDLKILNFRLRFYYNGNCARRVSGCYVGYLQEIKISNQHFALKQCFHWRHPPSSPPSSPPPPTIHPMCHWNSVNDWNSRNTPYKVRYDRHVCEKKRSKFFNRSGGRRLTRSEREQSNRMYKRNRTIWKRYRDNFVMTLRRNLKVQSK